MHLIHPRDNHEYRITQVMLCLIIIKVLPDYFALQMSYAVYLKRLKNVTIPKRTSNINFTCKTANPDLTIISSISSAL